MAAAEATAGTGGRTAGNSSLSRLWPLIGVAALAGILTWLASLLPPPSTSDFQQFWVAARALLDGQDPYAAVQAMWRWPLFYPLPAVLIVLPLSILPLAAARVIWAMVSAGLFMYAAQRTTRPLWIGALSASFLQAIVLGQWSPILTAAAVLPWVGAAWVAKPTVGLALFAGWPRRQAVIGGMLLVLVSLALDPHWPMQLWLNREAALYRAPVMRPGGVILLLALLRWRAPEARLLAAMACVPHAPTLYDTLPLFLIPGRKGEAYVVAILTYATLFLTEIRLSGGAPLGADPDLRWAFMLTLVYFPALVIVLRPLWAGTRDSRQPLEQPAQTGPVEATGMPGIGPV
jgi:hypothetical protein